MNTLIPPSKRHPADKHRNHEGATCWRCYAWGLMTAAVLVSGAMVFAMMTWGTYHRAKTGQENPPQIQHWTRGPV